MNRKPLKFTITSSFAETRELQQRILDGVHDCGYDPDTTFAIQVALEEAVINAIKHGNKLDPSKKVHVEARIDSKKAEIIVEDEGAGFARVGVPDPTEDENLCKCSGRGILLMEAYMDSVAWSKQGRRVKMVKFNRNGKPAPGL